jgi:sugar lactone lactonase YvrE
MISGRRTELISLLGIALNSRGTIYVADAGRAFPSPGNVRVYAARSNGDTAPIASIGGKDSGLYAPAAIALDSSGKIYVANYHAEQVGRGVIQPAHDSITVYGAHSHGDAAPIAEISGGETGLNSPDGIALDPSGKIYVANTGPWNGYPGTVTAYPAASNGDVTPVATITGGPDAGISRPEGIALDSSGNLYVTNTGDINPSSVTVYPAGTDHNVPPSAKIGDVHAPLSAQAIAIDSNGNIYAADPRGRIGPVGPPGESPGSINVYAPRQPRRRDAEGGHRGRCNGTRADEYRC